jgi:hypothetical protein
MTSSVPLPAEAGERLDLHNASIDVSAAAAGDCAMTDMQTGRVCHEPHHHSGGCSFVLPSSHPVPTGVAAVAARTGQEPGRTPGGGEPGRVPRTPDSPL